MNTSNDVLLIHRKFDRDIGIGVKYRENIDATLLHWHEFYEIEMIVSGSASISINGEVYDAKPGFICCLSPNDLHEIKNPQSLCLYNIAFDENIVNSDLLQKLIPLKRYCFIEAGSEKMKRFVSLFGLIEYEGNNHNHSQSSAIKPLLTAFVTYLTRSLDEANEGTDDAFPDLIRSVIAYINRNYNKDLKLRDIASMFYVNEHYLSSLFYKKVGVKYCDYLASLRVNNANSLLKTTSIPVSDISTMCGFGSYSNFTRAFKKRFGVSPTAARKLKIGSTK